MIFYQTNKRNPEQPFSEDEFKLSVKDLLDAGGLPAVQIIQDINSGVMGLNTDYFGDFTAVYNTVEIDRKISVNEPPADYLIQIGVAFLFLNNIHDLTADDDIKNKISCLLDRLEEAIGPRTGMQVIKSY